MVAKPEITEFLELTTTSSTDECIEWPFSHLPNGYGCCVRLGTRYATHVVLLMVGQSRPSPKHGALHSCDNPPCVNPRHLRWGLHSENMADAVARNRTASGERHGGAKLTASDVERATRLRAEGRSYDSIARATGVSRETIRRAVTGISWKGSWIY